MKNLFSGVRGSLKKLFVVVVAAAGMTVAAPAVPAFAINAVSCTSDEFAWIRFGDTGDNRWCYANSGVAYVEGYGVRSFHSGNNKVTFDYTIIENGYRHSLILDKGQEHTLTFGLRAIVHTIQIW
ncbi:beta/gamma crystallin domain-containing protein [Goodfellowiella coeruleoviolacea]|uniref:Beta/Gamma crystallin n=1 Tax=Goodfellowiella coeruleoviolacea TaxID=334858 RepID=A0AAE3GM35_9PSEU|nr:beta/gamma crystallin domain-containing protein [Goodfellowiella coeruleoviolacea]MCP2169919.1 Beta/Gamma crystallin [Goodfellowiella coeruleoviolacea]